LLNTPPGLAGPAYNIDQDTSEQAALKLTVNGNSATPIGAAGAGMVAFTVAGLDPEDTGTVTFTDASNKTVQVNVSGGQTSYHTDLSTLADGVSLHRWRSTPTRQETPSRQSAATTLRSIRTA
jgi:hypothetical protein